MPNVVKLDPFRATNVIIAMSVSGIARNARRKRVSFQIHDKVTGEKRVIWSKTITRKAKQNNSTPIFIYYSAVAKELTKLIKDSSRDNVRAILDGDKPGLVRRYMKHIMAEMREDAVKRRSGVIYDRDGWRVYHPVPSVWIMTVPQHIGTVTAVALEDKQHFKIDYSSGDTRKTFRYNNLYMGIIQGLGKLYSDNRMLYDTRKVYKVLDEAGISGDAKAVLSIETHRVLQRIIQELTHAAYEGGEKAMLIKLSDLNDEIKR